MTARQLRALLELSNRIPVPRTRHSLAREFFSASRMNKRERTSEESGPPLHVDRLAQHHPLDCASRAGVPVGSRLGHPGTGVASAGRHLGRHFSSLAGDLLHGGILRALSGMPRLSAADQSLFEAQVREEAPGQLPLAPDLVPGNSRADSLSLLRHALSDREITGQARSARGRGECGEPERVLLLGSRFRGARSARNHSRLRGSPGFRSIPRRCSFDSPSFSCKIPNKIFVESTFRQRMCRWLDAFRVSGRKPYSPCARRVQPPQQSMSPPGEGPRTDSGRGRKILMP